MYTLHLFEVQVYTVNSAITCLYFDKSMSSDVFQVDVILFREFLQWMDERSVSHDQPFLARIYKEDVGPCLNFPNKEVEYSVTFMYSTCLYMYQTFYILCTSLW